MRNKKPKKVTQLPVIDVGGKSRRELELELEAVGLKDQIDSLKKTVDSAMLPQKLASTMYRMLSEAQIPLTTASAAVGILGGMLAGDHAAVVVAASENKSSSEE